MHQLAGRRSWGFRSSQGRHPLRPALRLSDRALRCLSTVKDGQPTHPLYLRTGQQLQLFETGFARSSLTQRRAAVTGFVTNNPGVLVLAEGEDEHLRAWTCLSS